MSGISGSCTESPSRALFDQGIEKLQETKLEKDSMEEQKNQTVDSSGVKNQLPVAEGLKGSLFDAFA